MIPFDFQPRTRIVFGPDRVDSLGDLAAELGARRVLVVSDPGIVSAGHTGRGIASLERAGIVTRLFDAVEENPTSAHIEAGVEVAREFQPNFFVGLGGGSSMDCAKGINFVFTSGGRIQDYWGTGKARQPMLPAIAVPTTAGTGSEVQSYALISDKDTKVKMACGDKRAACRVALLDPTLSLTQPQGVTALTGIDAIAHALETYVTRDRNAVSLAFSREAWQLLAENFSRVLADPADVDARAGMLLGACFAGLAIENSMLGATHALANPLTAKFGIAHGQAIGLMLPHVLRFNGQAVDPWYLELMEYAPSRNGHPHASRACESLAALVGDWAAQAGLAKRLSDCGVGIESLPDLAADAARQWTGGFNPRKVGVEEMLSLYRAAF